MLVGGHRCDEDGAVQHARRWRTLVPVALLAGATACGGDDPRATLAGAKAVGATSVVRTVSTTLGPAPGVDVPAGPAQLYERLTDGLRSLGGVYHAVRTRTAAVGGTTRTEVWVDAARNLGKSAGPAGATSGAAAPPCYGAPAVVTLVLDCAKVLHDNGSVAISAATRDGVAVIVLVSKGGSLPTDGPPELAGAYRRTVFLDAASMLPLRIEVTGDAVGEVPLAVDSTTEFVWDVLPAASLPDAFFTA
jgi:hypothetical protein